MKDKYFKELARVFEKEGVAYHLENDDVFKVLLQGQVVCQCGLQGRLYFHDQYLKNTESEKLVETITPIVAQVYEYTTLMDTAPLVQSTSGNNDFHLLADFGGTILAGKEVALSGYQFVTWEKDGSGKGFNFGHYFGDSYASAKEDFALRSGLIARDKLFSEIDLSVMYKCMNASLEDGSILSYNETTLVEQLCEQMDAMYSQLMKAPQPKHFEMRM